MSSSQPIVVTGMGAVSAFGWGVDNLIAGLSSGESRVRETRDLDTRKHRVRIAAEVPREPPGVCAEFPNWRRLSRADRFAVAAAGEAFQDAQLISVPSDGGLFFGTSTAGMLECEEYVARILGTREGPPTTLLLVSQQLNGPGDAVARHFQMAGPVQTIASACASSTLAIRAAFESLKSGEIDMAVVGGSDSLCHLTYSGFSALRSLDREPCKPFQSDRSGLSLGEGAAVLILERVGEALDRGRRPMAEILGCGASCDAHHMTAPQPNGNGALRAMQMALREGGLNPEDLAFISAHGTGTLHNDSAEAAAFSSLLDRHLDSTPIVATKAALGHLLGASGAMEALATVLTLVRKELPRIAGGGLPDPALGVRFPGQGPLALEAGSAALSVNLGFGGANGAIVFRSWEG